MVAVTMPAGFDDPVGDLGSAVDGVAGLDPDGLSDAELSEALTALAREAARLEAARARLTGAWDARGVWGLDGARSGAAWLAHRNRVPVPAARRQVRLARAVRAMPVVEAAWDAGEITADHVARFAAARNHRTEEPFARDEQMLVGYARRLSFAHFTRALAFWEAHADPDGAETDADRLFEQRRAHCSQTLNRKWRLDADLDPIGGTEFATALERIEQELFDADWADAKARHGDQVTADHLARTPTQRRADALVEMARRATTAPADGKRPRPLITFRVGYRPDTIGRVIELANGTPATPAQVAQVIRHADIERAVFGPNGRVIDLGRTARLFTGSARHALDLAFPECDFPGCDQPAHRCQADHIQPWEHDGPTNQHNGHLVCPHHHRLLHHHRTQPFSVTTDENGTTHWHRPDGTPIT